MLSGVGERRLREDRITFAGSQWSWSWSYVRPFTFEHFFSYSIIYPSCPETRNFSPLGTLTKKRKKKSKHKKKRFFCFIFFLIHKKIIFTSSVPGRFFQDIDPHCSESSRWLHKTVKVTKQKLAKKKKKN